MSTKFTIAYGHEPDTDFHFYQECFDGDHVYMELRGQEVEYEVEQGRVMMRIPIEVWEVMRMRYGTGGSAPYAEVTDEQIEVAATSEVDENIAAWREYIEAGNDHGRRLREIDGAAKSRDEQLAERRERHLQRREEHRERKGKIDRLMASQWNHD